MPIAGSLVPMGNMSADAATSAAQASTQSAQQTQQNNPLELLATLLKSNAAPSNMLLTTTQAQIPQPAPLVPRQNPNIQMDDREFATGTGNARVARNNVFRNLSSIVNTASQQREEKQVRTLQNDITRMFGAMEGYQQAQASGNKEMEAHNKQIISDILGDPKKAKQIEKAFDINLLGDQKNPTENKALMQAYAAWQKGGRQGENPLLNEKRPGGSTFDKFQRAMPQIQGMNPALVAQMQMQEMNKKAGGVTDKDRLDAITKVATTQMVTHAHEIASKLGYYGRLDTEVQRGINEMNKTLLQNAGKKDAESLDKVEKTVKNTHEMLSKSIAAKEKAIKDLGTTFPFTQDRRQKEQLQQDLEVLKKLMNENESYQLLIQKQRTGEKQDAGAGNTTSTGTGTGNTGNKAASNPASDGTKGSSGETLGLPSNIYDEFYKQFWQQWFGGGSNNDDPYAGRKPI